MSLSIERKFEIKGRDTYRTEMNQAEIDAEISETSDEEYELNSSFEQQRNKTQVLERSINKSIDRTTPRSPKYIQTTEAVEESSLIKKALIVIILTILLAIWASQYIGNDKTIINIDGLKQIFPNQPNETFENFETIIDEIVFERAVHPAVFLFLYDKNEQKVNEIVHHLADYASMKLVTNNEYIDVDKKEFHSKDAYNDYGYLIDKYRSALIEKKVMLVKNLHNIPAQTAQVFHSFCDEISPLVERVVYIFTLKVDSLKGKEEKIAESYLKKYWKELESDILMPLITRVTSTVLKIVN